MSGTVEDLKTEERKLLTERKRGSCRELRERELSKRCSRLFLLKIVSRF